METTAPTTRLIATNTSEQPKGLVHQAFSLNIGGLPVIGTLVGSFLLLSTMFMWYGSFFRDSFQPLMGITEEMVDAESLGIWYAMGFVFAAIQGIGLATVLKWRNWPGVAASARTGAIAATRSRRLALTSDAASK